MSLLEPGLEFLPGLTLLRPLGRGGMGEAWLARDAERGEEVVAKVVPADASLDKVALLRREARLVRKLTHPRIVPVYGFRSGERGSAVTQRYMPGGDAGKKRGAPPLEVARLGRDVAEALGYLHGLGVVHRDVKPSNVLLDGEGRACLADFGIAAVAWGDEEGIVLRGGGSRSSLSPQQIAGEPAQPADDLYAFGSLLFELLSGRPPFPREASDEEIRTVSPPPVASPFPVPDALRGLVASLLSKSPEGRPPSAAAVREALQAIEAQLGGALPAAPRPPVRLQPPPRVSPAAVVPAELRDRIDRLGSRPTRAGFSAGQVTLLAALGVAVVVAVAWLPRWAQAPTTPEPEPTSAASKPTPADPPAVPEATAAPRVEALPSAPAPDPPVHSAARPRRPVALASPDPPPAPAPTPDRLVEAAALSRHRDAARALEELEDWGAALAEYEAALAVDPHVRFALEGKERTSGRVALADGLDFHARNAHRLSTEGIAREAEALLERARGVEAPGPHLRAQVAALEKPLADARTPVAVIIESDGLTEVAVSRIGRLGTFKHRTVDLRPGEYTATGSRRGYRDVRRRFTVSSDAATPTVVVRCEEAL
jgi:eukaryotic-like serine/threonine-protein kinase